MGAKRSNLGMLEEVLSTMGRPDSGVPEAEDPYFGVNYEDDLLDIMDMEVPEDAPEAFLWRLLIMPAQPRAMSKGGIALPNKVMEAEEHLNYIGKVVGIGPLAGKSEKFANPAWTEWRDNTSVEPPPRPEPPRYLWDIKVGDWVIYGRYTGQKCWFKGAKMIFVNDDEILGKAKAGPVGFKVYAA